MNVFFGLRACTKRAASLQANFYLASRRVAGPSIPRYIHTSPRPSSTQRSNASDPPSSKPVFDPNSKPKNDNIPYERVFLVNSETGKLQESTLKDVLASFSRKTHFAELQRTEPFPVVKIIDKSEAHHKKLKAKEQQKAAARKNVRKEFQFTWGMAQGDVSYRMERVKDALGKGSKVDIVFAPKPGVKTGPALPEMKQRMDELVDGLKDMSSEYKQREFRKFFAAVFLQGSRKETAESS